MSLVSVKNITKDFGRRRGVFGLNFEIGYGEIVGFVGPNGAGKSTTINILAGFVKPDAGNMVIFDLPTDHLNVYKLMPRIGLLFAENTLQEDLTASQTFKRSQELLRQDLSKNWQDMAKLLELDLDKPVKKLSLGNKKKVAVINALMHKPDLLILDEPTSGLDPLITSRFFGLLEGVVKRGGSVFLSSHELAEVQQICSRIMMIKNGKIIISDTTQNILEKAYKVFIFKNIPDKLLKSVQTLSKSRRTIRAGDETKLYTKDARPILNLFAKNKFYDFYLERPSLEEMFQESYK